MRQIDPLLKAHMGGRVTAVFDFVWLDFENDPVFAHNDIGDIRWDPGLPSPNAGSKTWTGAGNLGQVDPISEDPSLNADTYTLILRGMTQEFVNEARSLNHLQREVRIWKGARDLSTGALVGTPLPVLRGVMDSLDTKRNRGGSSVLINISDERALLSRGAGILFSQQQQQARHAGDGFFRQAARTATREIVWGPGASDAAKGGAGNPVNPYNIPRISFR